MEPVLCYGSEVWGFHAGPAIEKLHTRFCRQLLRVKSTTPNDIVRGELGRRELKYNRYIRIIKY